MRDGNGLVIGHFMQCTGGGGRGVVESSRLAIGGSMYVLMTINGDKTALSNTRFFPCGGGVHSTELCCTNHMHS